MTAAVDGAALDRLFLDARTHSKFLDRPVGDDLLRRAWELARMGPTSANCQPARIVFVRSDAAKQRLKPALMPGNVDKTMAAPVTAIIGHDLEFYERLPRLFPHADARSWFVGNDALIQATAFRNGTLQGGYFILACRALGLDCGPMSGFDNAKVDAEFFPGGTVRSNFLVNIGWGEASGLHPRGPRLDFDEACRTA
ncbi:MAG: malonic semialdehyde reductase [Actinomycetota bacterium]